MVLDPYTKWTYLDLIYDKRSTGKARTTVQQIWEFHYPGSSHLNTSTVAIESEIQPAWIIARSDVQRKLQQSASLDFSTKASSRGRGKKQVAVLDEYQRWCLEPIE